MATEDDQFVIHGPEPFEPVPKDTLGKTLFNSLLTCPLDKDAMVNVFTGETITYRTILEEAVNLAEALRKIGCTKDTIISISGENSLQFFIPVAASLFAGTILSPMNPLYTPDEMKHTLSITKPRIMFVSQMVAPMFLELKELGFIERFIVFNTEESVEGAQNLKEFLNEQLGGHRISPYHFVPYNENAEESIAFIMGSSGTTGLPKGVMLTHRNIMVRAAQARDPRYNDGTTSHAVVAIMPFFHGYGLNLGISCLMNRYFMATLSMFDEDAYLQAIQDYKVTLLTLAPPLAVFLAKTPKLDNYDLSHVQYVVCGAAPLSKDVEETLKQRLNVHSVQQAYGLTEVNLAVTVMDKDVIRPGSVGQVITYMSVKVRDPETGRSLGPNQVGEICIKGPQVMKGYYKNEQATRETFTSDGWLRTGDLGYYDKDHYFYIVDRLKELIKYKGYQVAPAELEAVLLTHPDVIDCGVVGYPDELAGELPTAFVVRNKDSLTEVDLQNFVSKKVSPQKRLRGGVIFVPEIPKNPSGKILRRELKKLLLEYKKSQKSKL